MAADDIRVPAEATLLLLAGGESRRMGRSKALLEVEGTTLIEWLAERLAPGFEELRVAAREASQLPPGLRPRLVADTRPGAGPLAGIEAGLAAARYPTVVVVACDMPYVTLELTGRLVEAAQGHDAAVPRVGERVEPACAAYRRSAAAPITAALEAGDLRLADALAALQVAWLEGEDPALFTNLNTPEDYRAFLAATRKTR
jgi:molybdopterin-guanine dinucleotide biosynthesis protein A